MRILKPLLVTVSLSFAWVAQAQICSNNAKIAQLGMEVENRALDFERLLQTKPEREAVLERVNSFVKDAVFFNDLVTAEASCDRVVQEFQGLGQAYIQTRQVLAATHHPDRTGEVLTAWNFVKVKMADLDLAVHGRSLDEEDSDPHGGGNGGGGGKGDDNGDRAPANRLY